MKKLFLCKKNFNFRSGLGTLMESSEWTFETGKYYSGEETDDYISVEYVVKGYGTLTITVNGNTWTNATSAEKFYKNSDKDDASNGYYTFAEYFYTNKELRRIKLEKLKYGN